MKFSKKDIQQLRAELLAQRDPVRPKKRRGKKLFPIRYSSDFISVTQSPRIRLGEQVVVFEGKPLRVSDAIYDYNKRAKGPPLLESKPVPNAPVYGSVDAYIRTWASKAGQMHGVDVFHQLRLSASYVLYFHGNQYFIEWTQLDETVKLSRMYDDKDYCINLLNARLIEWVN